MNAKRGARSANRDGRHGRAATVDNPRRVAYDVLAAVSNQDSYANLVLPKLLRQRAVSGRDAAFATELCYGTLRQRGSLDAIIASAGNRSVAALDQAVADVLRLGAYQLLYTRVAAHAAVNTTVSLARKVCGHRPAGFVNAVMRKIATRDLDGWLDALSTGEEITDLALRHSHPEWMVRGIAEALGSDDELREALAADNQAPAVHLCARPGMADSAELAAENGGHQGRWAPHAVVLEGGDPADVASIAKGYAHVQDEGSQLVALALANATVDGRDERWLDLCAGPGGKAALLASLARQRGAHLTAVEVSEHRAQLVAKSTEGLDVEVVAADGRQFTTDDRYDRVLVDAPCSGLGALRRRPEARWRRSEADLADLRILQRQLLTSALELVRPNGVVAYVTCSPVIAETRDIVAGVEENVSLVDARELFPDGMPALGEGPFVQLWPHRHGTDAMFCAILRREA